MAFWNDGRRGPGRSWTSGSYSTQFEADEPDESGDRDVREANVDVVPVDDDVDQLELPLKGVILGSFNVLSFGLAWKLQNVLEIEMLTTEPIETDTEEKIFYSLDLEDTFFEEAPTIIELFKIENCDEVRLRAVKSQAEEEDEDGEKPLLNPDHFLFGVTVVNSAGEIVIEEKTCRGWMDGGYCWEIPDFITPAQFDLPDLLDENGDMHLRVSFCCKLNLPNIEAFPGTAINPSAVGGFPNGENGDNYENVESDEEKRKRKDCVAVACNYVSKTGLDPFSARLQKLLTTKKFCDGSIIVAPEGQPRQTFPVHRAILSAQSKVFEAAFEREPEITLSKYSPPTVEAMLNYVYSGELICGASLSRVSELLEVAEEMNIIGLKERSVNLVLETDIEEFSIQDGITCYKLSQKHNSIHLRLRAMEIFELHENELKGNAEVNKLVQEHQLELFFPMSTILKNLPAN